jgi:hypothetical protein
LADAACSPQVRHRLDRAMSAAHLEESIR